MNQLVTRWPGGFTNARPGSLMGDLKVDRPNTYFSQFNDFAGAFVPADWILTGTGTVAVSQTLANGIAVVTNSAANGDETSLQWAGNTGGFLGLYNNAATKDLIFAASIQLPDVLNTGILLGLATVDTSPITSLPLTGMFVYKPAASLFPQGYLRQAGVGGLTAQSQTPLVNNAWVDVSVQYIAAEGVCRMYIGDAAFRIPAPLTLATGALAPTLSIRNGTAGAKVMNLDWWYAGSER